MECIHLQLLSVIFLLLFAMLIVKICFSLLFYFNCVYLAMICIIGLYFGLFNRIYFYKIGMISVI